MSAHPGRTANPLDSDPDYDGDVDGADNCPLIVNADQANGDTLPAGNDCQCGDVTNDGIVNATDHTRARTPTSRARTGGVPSRVAPKPKPRLSASGRALSRAM